MSLNISAGFGLTRCGNTQTFVFPRGVARRGISLLSGFKQREIPRFARNDKNKLLFSHRLEYQFANAGYSRSARFAPAEAGALPFSGLCRGAPSADLGFRLDFSILDTA